MMYTCDSITWRRDRTTFRTGNGDIPEQTKPINVTDSHDCDSALFLCQRFVYFEGCNQAWGRFTMGILAYEVR